MKGKLIVIDGADGSGKATQAKLLMEYLKSKKLDVEMLDYPRYGRPSAYFVEQYLNGKYGTVNEVSPRLASLFYSLDRFDSKKDIIDSLKQGKIVISNRYVSANAGHQGGKIKDLKQRNEFLDWLNNLEYETCGLPRPDIKIYLHVPYDIGQKLVDKKVQREYLGQKKRDIHEDDLDHLKNTEKAYIYLTKKESGWITIDCIENSKLLSIEKIHKKIVEKIKDLL
jgi:dTMP kinase